MGSRNKSGGGRGCGSRQQNSFYACVGTSPDGRPVEWFIQDPAIRLGLKQGEVLRAPLLIPSRNNEYNHLCLGIGVTYYPFVSDFTEEVRWRGVSKKIPKGYDLSSLDPERSALILAHPRAIPEFDYTLRREWCPRKISGKPVLRDQDTGEILPHQCTGDLWDLSSVKSYEEVHEIDEDDLSEWVTAHTPSVDYDVMKAYQPDESRLKGVGTYSWGIILKFPHFHFQYINKDGKAPRKLKRSVEDSRFELRIVDE